MFFCLFPLYIFASHNQAGEIVFKQIDNRTVEITVITYTKISSMIPRDSILINWGDGVSTWVKQNIGSPEEIDDFSDTQITRYTKFYTYPGPGIYEVYFEDPYRNAGVRNIPNSEIVPMTLTATIYLSPFLGINQSPVLLNPPLERACVDELFMHNPAAFDADNDSLVYTITIPKGDNAIAVNNYVFLDGLHVDSISGTFSWDFPQFTGQYNFAIKVEEFRNGFKIGELIRDMQVNVSVCNNQSPRIFNPKDVCVRVGDTLRVPVKAVDTNLGDRVTLSASGGAISEVLPPRANFNTLTGTDSVEGELSWVPECWHIIPGKHNVIFKAIDDHSNTPLTSFSNLSIKVISPPTLWDTASVNANYIKLNWLANLCAPVAYYEIYRSISPIAWEPGYCEQGIPSGIGYEKIAEVNDTILLDSAIYSGIQYCYRIVAVLSNGERSVSSAKICIETSNNQVVLTKVSVLETDETSGVVELVWRKPIDWFVLGDYADLKYRLWHKVEGVSELIYESFSLEDTTFVHNELNTSGLSHEYWVEVVNQDKRINSSAAAFNPYLSGIILNQSAQLTVETSVPWQNFKFIWYLKDLSDNFLILDTTLSPKISVDNLTNGQAYCFKVLTVGKYSGVFYPDTLINLSQELCLIPMDLEAPCLPDFTIISDCPNNTMILDWTYQNDTCDADLQSTLIYRKNKLDAPYTLLAQFEGKNTNTYTWIAPQTIVGCYALEFIDTANNTTGIVLERCVAHCALLQFPNVFTPNQDGINDFFTPVISHQIHEAQLYIYNRWGNLVYQSEGIPILWDGVNQSSGSKVSAGVYYYTVNYTYLTLQGVDSQILNGFIQVLD